MIAEPGAEPDVTTAEEAIIGPKCPPEFCGTNSPLIAFYGTWEFNLRGLPNQQGFTLLGLRKRNQFYDLDVRGSRIIGRDRAGTAVLMGQALAGATIYLDQGGSQHAIVISSFGTVHEVVGSGDALEAYVLDWADVISHPLPRAMRAGEVVDNDTIYAPTLSSPAPVCPAPTWYPEEGGPGTISEWEETFAAGMSPFQSLVFEGDRFDPYARTVEHRAADDWFNVGCGAHTLVKLRLTRNTIHTAPGWANVQATMKMLGADYCGGGKAFTYPGEPLVWRDVTAMQYMSMNSSRTLEARWNESGAMCLNEPRLAHATGPSGAGVYTDIEQQVAYECKLRGRSLPRCTNLDALAWDGELVTSANYD
jgi:hypothetical protein